jgi:sulfite reductase alpha subunit-like flavoprotein
MTTRPSALATPSTTHQVLLAENRRITPAGSPEDVRQLRFSTDDLGFDPRIGQCVRVRAPGQFGQRFHERLYSVADVDRRDPQTTTFDLLVRRCTTIDDFNGERYPGVASNFLCDLTPGARVDMTGPVGHPFDLPADRNASLLMIGMGTGIAPFRGLVRRIYDTLGGWEGKVRLFYGARSGLEMLYMNDENADLAHYYDRETFKAFQAVSPRPHFGAPPALEAALGAHAAEVWEMLQDPRTQVFVAGPEALLGRVDQALADVAGSAERWQSLRREIVAQGRWHDVLY